MIWHSILDYIKSVTSMDGKILAMSQIFTLDEAEVHCALYMKNVWMEFKRKLKKKRREEYEITIQPWVIISKGLQ